jgi:hypothetical protein
MKTSCHFAALALLLLTGCNDAPPPSTSSPTRAESGDYLSQTAQAARRAQRTVDVVAMNKAIEKFYLQEGRFPTNLVELARLDYIPLVPVLPTGMAWNYDTNSGIVSVIKEAIRE